MGSPRTCFQCWRIFRLQNHRPQAIQVFEPPSRPFSSQFRRLQHTPPSRDLPPGIPTAPPTTTGTITSNITAQTPGTENATPDPPSSSSSSPSTAEMQRTISSTLSRPDLPHTLASKLRAATTKTTDPYIAYGITQSLFHTCSLQADYTIPESQRQGILTGQGPAKTPEGEDLGLPDPETRESWWFTELGLQPTFSTWSQVTYLHMYVLIVRLRAMQDRGTVSKYQHYLLDHFSHKAEDKMVLLHGMSARGIRNRYLKDLFLQWRGILAAYDEGLVKGDAVLAAAVWRNLWKGQEDVDWEMVAKAVGWMRRCVRLLGEVGDAEVQGSAEEIFERARKGVKEMVGKESKGIREEPRAEEEGKVVPGSP